MNTDGNSRHRLIVDQIVTTRILGGDKTDPRIMTAEASEFIKYQEKQNQIEGLLK